MKLEEQRIDKHELSGKVVIDGHVFHDAGKSGRSTYGRYSTLDPNYKKDPKEAGMHRNYRKPSSLSFSTLAHAKKWVKSQPKKSAEHIDATHKKYAEREKIYTEEITNSVGTGGFTSSASPTGPVAGFDPLLGKMVRRKVQTFKNYIKKKDGTHQNN
jgi:hypothetical protein